jgi:DNA topoisomerase-3
MISFTSRSKPHQVAETLYNRGFISYPRTETDSFVEGTYLNGLIAIHTADPNWGNYAQQYVACLS